MKCFNCGVITRESRHPYRCAGEEYEYDTIKKLQIDVNYFEFSKETFLQEYVDNKMSLPQMKNKYGLPYKSTEFLCQYFNIPKRGASEAVLASRARAKETCIARYGVENPSQCREVKAKKEATFEKNYGVNNIFKTDLFKVRHALLMQERYGQGSLPNRYGGKDAWWAKQSDEYRAEVGAMLGEATRIYWSGLSDDAKKEIIDKRLQTLIKNEKPRNHYSSGLESKVADALLDLDIEFTRQYWFKQRLYDFKIIGTNVLIEVQGDYWHANPNKYEPDHVMPFGGTAREKWDRDHEKKELAEKAGFLVIQLWECDLIKDMHKVLADTILPILGA